MVATLNIRARFEPYPNSPGFSDEAGVVFCVELKDFAVLVVAPQGKTTVSFRSPVPPHSAGSKWKTVDSTFDTGALTKPGALVTYSRLHMALSGHANRLVVVRAAALCKCRCDNCGIPFELLLLSAADPKQTHSSP